MYLDIVILSHLLRGPRHGYELKRNVADTTAFALHNNTLYPALRRFEEAGAVVKTAEQDPGRPPRHVYELTTVGREMLHDMLADLPPEQAGDENEFLTRVGLFEDLTPDERRRILAARAAALREHGAHLRHLSAKAARSMQHGRWGGAVVTELARRTDRELEWIAELDADAGRP